MANIENLEINVNKNLIALIENLKCCGNCAFLNSDNNIEYIVASCTKRDTCVEIYEKCYLWKHVIIRS
jgi:hypothetical protein